MEPRVQTLRPSLVCLLRGRDLVLVEVGVEKGVNAKSILTHLRVKTLYLIDPYKAYDDGPGGAGLITQETVDEAKACARTLLAPHDSRLVWIESDSLTAGQEFGENSLDGVYLDGDHSYLVVKQELELYWPKIKPGGLMAGHDYDLGQYGVKRAVHEWSRSLGLKHRHALNDWWLSKPLDIEPPL